MASQTEHGAHFKAKHTRLPDIAVAVGCICFALTASAGVVATTAGLLADGGTSLAHVTGLSASVTQGDEKKPIEAKPDTSTHKDAGADVSLKTDSSDKNESKPSNAGTASDAMSEGSGGMNTLDEDANKPATSTAEPRIHIIAHGETLCGISAQYGVSVDSIAIENQIRDVNLIYAESALVIP